MDKKMVKNNRNGNESQKTTAFSEEQENTRLRKVLQKAVLKETAPESLRDAIKKMIRQ